MVRISTNFERIRGLFTGFSIANLLGWTIDLILTLALMGVLSLLGFQLGDLNGALSAAVFTVVISSSAVLFTAFTSNSELVLAVKRANHFPIMISLFAIPIVASLLGLLFSLLGTYYYAPGWMASWNAEVWLAHIIAFLSIYAILGFLGTTLFVLITMAAAAVKDGEQGSN